MNRLAAALYLGFYLTFVTWYHLPRQVSIRAEALETWPFGGLALWGELLAPFWNRPCMYVLCLGALTGLFWALRPQSRSEDLRPGLVVLEALKLLMVAADLRLLTFVHLAQLVLTGLFLVSPSALRVGFAVLALVAAVREPVAWLALAGVLLALYGRPWLLFACLAARWLVRGLTAPVSPMLFDDSGWLLILAVVAFWPAERPARRADWWPVLLAPLAFLPFWPAPRPLTVRYTYPEAVVVVRLSRPGSATVEAWTPSGRIRRLTRPLEREGRRIFAPDRFELLSPEILADPAFHRDLARRSGAEVELFLDP